MDIFEYAMQMELDGEAYYRQLAQKVPNKGLKAILSMLADDEVKHYNAIEKVRIGNSQMATTTILTDAKNIFVQLKNTGEEFDIEIDNDSMDKMLTVKAAMDIITTKLNEK